MSSGGEAKVVTGESTLGRSNSKLCTLAHKVATETVPCLTTLVTHPHPLGLATHKEGMWFLVLTMFNLHCIDNLW